MADTPATAAPRKPPTNIASAKRRREAISSDVWLLGWVPMVALALMLVIVAIGLITVSGFLVSFALSHA